MHVHRHSHDRDNRTRFSVRWILKKEGNVLEDQLYSTNQWGRSQVSLFISLMSLVSIAATLRRPFNVINSSGRRWLSFNTRLIWRQKIKDRAAKHKTSCLMLPDEYTGSNSWYHLNSSADYWHKSSCQDAQQSCHHGNRSTHAERQGDKTVNDDSFVEIHVRENIQI